MTILDLQSTAKQVRIDLINMLATAGSGHTAGSLSITDVLTFLYFNQLNVNPSNPSDSNRDRFVLSCAHMVPALYSVLANKGFFSKDLLNTLREYGSPLQGHTFRNLDIGIETTGGSLGQGISVAMGMAMAARLNNSQHKVYCLISDGEVNEGQVWEAAMFGAKYNLTNLILVLDNNGVQQSGNAQEIMPTESLQAKWEAFGWNVLQVNGHDFTQIQFAFAKAGLSGKPTIIISNSIAGKGVAQIEGKAEWHGKVPTPEQAKEWVKMLADSR